MKREIWANAVLSNGEILFWCTCSASLRLWDFERDFIDTGLDGLYKLTHRLKVVNKKFVVDYFNIAAYHKAFYFDARDFYRQFKISPDCKVKKPY